MRALRFNPPQSAAYRVVAPNQTVTLAFGRGTGKSWFIRRVCYLLISQWEYQERETADGTLRGIRIVFLLPTFKQFKDVHARALVDELADQFGFLGAKVDHTTYTVTFPGGSSIQVFPASEHGGQRARGIRADVALLDEADDIDISVYDSVIRPWFTEPWSMKIRIVSGTPKRGRHGLLWRSYQSGLRGARCRAGLAKDLSEAQIRVLSRFHSVHATYRDTPGNVDQEEAEAARLTMPAATFEREYECNFDAGEGLVYPFDEAFHVREAPPLDQFREFLVGMDFGHVDAGVMLLIGIQGHGEDAVAWVVDEHYASGRQNSDWDDLAKQWSFAPFWCDPSRADRIATLRGLAIDCRDLPADVKPIVAGISRVRDMMFRRPSEDDADGNPVPDWAKLFIAPHCANLIRELGLYRNKKNPDGTFSEEPEDKNNHACDALRYALAGRFGRPVNYRHVVSGR